MKTRSIIVLLSIIFVVSGTVILYINPDSAINKLLFFNAISFASCIPLLLRKGALKRPFFHNKVEIGLLIGMVLLSSFGVYLTLFSKFKHQMLIDSIFILFMLLVLCSVFVFWRQAKRRAK